MLEFEDKNPAGDALGHELPKILRLGARIEQTVSHKIQLPELFIRQLNWIGKQRIESLEHRRHGADRTSQISGDACGCWVVAVDGSNYVEMVS